MVLNCAVLSRSFKLWKNAAAIAMSQKPFMLHRPTQFFNSNQQLVQSNQINSLNKIKKFGVTILSLLAQNLINTHEVTHTHTHKRLSITN